VGAQDRRIHRQGALTEIEETYLNIGGERVHGKGAARLQVKDLVLALMA
jgi:hypothetical protein